GSLPLRRHLRPGLAQDVDDLGVVVTTREFGEEIFQEHEAGGILEHLRLRVRLETFLAQQLADPRDGRGVVAGLDQNLAGGLGMEIRERAAPAMVALLAGRIVAAWNGPAPDML